MNENTSVRKRPIIKLCGNLSWASVMNISPLKPDWLGFIFYKKSKRYFQESPAILRTIVAEKKVGVFVNHPEEEVLHIGKAAALDFIQLHGEESSEYCKKVAHHFSVIKTIGVSEDTDFSNLNIYEPFVSYFLFDTASPDYGGTGKSFNRSLITQKYQLDKPYIISGGINIQEALSLLDNPPKHMIGIDINSQFELSPGVKDNVLIQQLLQQVYEC